MIQKLFTMLILLTFSISAGAEVMTLKGDVFDLSGKEKFYNFERYTSGTSDSSLLKNFFKDMKGQIVVEESAQLENGKLKIYKVEQKQTGESGEVSISGKKVYFTYRKKDGSVEKEMEDLEDNFIIGMTLVSHLKKNWQKLLNGDSLRTRLGVWHRAETVGFKFWKDKEKKEKGKEVVTIVMKPTSFVIRALVDPLYLTFDKSSKELLTVKGRTTPKIQKNGKWTDFDAFIRYSKVN